MDFNRDAVIAAAREVGDMALRAQHERGFRVWNKEPNQPVSDIDLAVDDRLRAVLGAILPDAAWLSEETVDDPARLSARALWCVDPIDGTRDFVAGRDGWAVSVALVIDGAPRFGLLYAPAQDALWLAGVGEGATRNGDPVEALPRDTFPGARVPADRLPREDADLSMVAKPNSIALRMAMVANGSADLVATLRWGAEWDVAAAALIVAEAGGVVTDAFGAPLAFNKPAPDAFGLIACAPGIHAAAVARLADRAAQLGRR